MAQFTAVTVNGSIAGISDVELTTKGKLRFLHANGRGCKYTDGPFKGKVNTGLSPASVTAMWPSTGWTAPGRRNTR